MAQQMRPQMSFNDSTLSTQPGSDSGETMQDMDPAANRLAQDTTILKPHEFYELIGMLPQDEQGMAPAKLASPHGFYSNLKAKERSVNRKFWIYDIMVNVLLVVQLILSAVFIVLGSINPVPHVAVTVLGAITTTIAGTLALVKGQGQPNRMRMERDGFRTVIFTADEMYWDAGAGKGITYGDIKKLREAYWKVVNDATKNNPDTWTSSTTPKAIHTNI